MKMLVEGKIIQYIKVSMIIMRQTLLNYVYGRNIELGIIFFTIFVKSRTHENISMIT